MHSHIYKDPYLGQWRLDSLKTPGKYLLMNDKRPSAFPIGTKEWTLGTDSVVCGKKANSHHLLTLTTCFPDMFTCDNGQCIDLE